MNVGERGFPEQLPSNNAIRREEVVIATIENMEMTTFYSFY